MLGPKIIYLKSEVKMFTLIIVASMAMGALKDPYRIHNTQKQTYVNKIIIESRKRNLDPTETIAIALTESALNPTAYSHTKDVGLFQVNCRWWYKKFSYKSIRACEKGLLDPDKNIKAGLFILTYFRKNFKQCAGTLAYRCYNGGQGWRRSKNRDKIIRYSKSVKRRRGVVNKWYGNYIYHFQRSATNG